MDKFIFYHILQYMLYDIDSLKIEFIQSLFNNSDDILAIFSECKDERYIETELVKLLINDSKYLLYIINCTMYEDFMGIKRIKFNLVVDETKKDVLDYFDLPNVRMYNSFNFEYTFLRNYFAYTVRSKKIEELLKMI